MEDEHVAYTPPQETPSAMPSMPQLPRNPFSIVKWLFLGVIGVVCFFGLLNVFLQLINPQKKSPTAETANITTTTTAVVEWKNYVDKKYAYSVSYPDDLELSNESAYTTVFLAKNAYTNRLQFPTLYVSVIPNGLSDVSKVYNSMSASVIQKMYAAKDGEVIQTQTSANAEYWNFKRLAMIPLAGTDAIVIENDNVLEGNGLANRRILLKKHNATYILGSYFGSQQELDLFKTFIESFKFE